ncbi:hypothetical protein DERP_000472 [Dermatophagoides pteronyssinus]|uniref:Uncharacterized protein n=1 Tax=Dermatophagoides pteronyssinus TaxID=6956 RepID=A0ABQ8J0F8_DERPT|nr:hypothetical protein DERP_000472 [Dermatophagoides pteronyssinus]
MDVKFGTNLITRDMKQQQQKYLVILNFFQLRISNTIFFYARQFRARRRFTWIIMPPTGHVIEILSPATAVIFGIRLIVGRPYTLIRAVCCTVATSFIA